MGLLVALMTAASAAFMASPAAAAICYYGACFNYVSGSQSVSGTGAQVTMTVGQPRLSGGPSEHSLMELAIQGSNSNNVEVGWMVDPATFGDSRPHLFVYHWVNGQTSCYNGCGWRSSGSSSRAGMALQAGQSITVGIQNSAGDWWVSFNGTNIGYFPGSLWNNGFTRYNRVQAFGEVASRSGSACIGMGNGTWGSQSGAASIRNYRLTGASAQPGFSVSSTDPSLYNSGSVSRTSFALGGPGNCR
ncbi:neprosin family prolyl endopeptidase [Spirillospora sp. NPDC047418]